MSISLSPPPHTHIHKSKLHIPAQRLRERQGPRVPNTHARDVQGDEPHVGRQPPRPEEGRRFLRQAFPPLLLDGPPAEDEVLGVCVCVGG